MPPTTGKPKDWIELNYTLLGKYEGTYTGLDLFPCGNGYNLIRDTNTYRCYELHKTYGDMDFSKYNIVTKIMQGTQGYENTGLTIRLWINFKRKEWCVVTSRTSRKASFNETSALNFTIKTPVIPSGFKEVR
jgi:hypothetical protein